jgi:hypothetical protein
MGAAAYSFDGIIIKRFQGEKNPQILKVRYGNIYGINYSDFNQPTG